MKKALCVCAAVALMVVLATGCHHEVPKAPMASFRLAPTAGSVPLSVAFTDTSAPGTAPITAWVWDFGDGTSSIERNPSHTYMAPGTYDVWLLVTSSVGSDLATQTAGVAVGKATPMVTAWPTVIPVTSGLTLASLTLIGGAASVPGTFAFDLPDTVLAAGLNTVAVTFTPEDTAYYNTVPGSVQVTAIDALFVKPGASGNGSSWDSPLGSLQQAVDTASQTGVGEIWVATGTYSATLESLKDAEDTYTLVMAAGVHLYGGFTGSELERDARDWEANPTIIDGDLTHPCVAGASDATLDGFTVQHGHAGYGGGMHNNAASPTVGHCVFTENSAARGGAMYNGSSSAPIVTACTFTKSMASYGGAISNETGAPDITECVFANNTATCGGGIHNDAASPAVTNCTFTANTATGSPWYTGYGGAIYNSNSAPAITQCTFSGNTVTGNGAGVFNGSASAPQIVDCTFEDNAASGSWYSYDTSSYYGNSIGYYSYGGAISNDASSPIVTRCLFDGNSSDYGAGMSSLHVSVPEITGCTFHANTAEETGGGMYNEDASPTLERCTFTANRGAGGGGMGNYSATPVVNACIFTRNTASNGGAVYNRDETPVFTNCILSANSAYNGGAIDNYDANSAITNCVFTRNVACSGSALSERGTSVSTVTNSILWGDSSLSGGEIYNMASQSTTGTTTVAYSCIQNGYTGIGNITSDPLLAHAATEQVRLRPGSPCIDAGTVTGAPAADIEGIARPQGAGADMGAYELDDADGDGISDAWEYRHFNDLVTATAHSDTDDDGLSDGDESLFGSDPTLADSDGDAMTDGDEVAQGWNPTVLTVVYRVSPANASGTEDGRSWATAFTSIQAAVDAVQAAGEGEVWVAAGAYTLPPGVEKVTNNLSNVVTMAENVHLFGGFTGTETTRDARDWESNLSIIDGEDIYRCVYGADDATLDGFIIQNGHAVSGAGMYNTYCSPMVRHCTFTGNVSTSWGGGMCNWMCCFPEIRDCQFAEGVATYGGGIVDYSSSPTITHCTFRGNTANSYGGGIYSYFSSSVLANCVFSGNAAAVFGGGAYNHYAASPSFINNLFTENTAAYGGGLSSGYSSAAVLTNCTFSRNTATTYGGGVYNSTSSALTLTNCILWGDSAGTDGNECYDITTKSSAFVPVVTFSCVQGGYDGNGNIASDPLFTNPANSDYHPQPGSPCIDSGTTTGAPDTDIRGAVRPQGAGVDMGVYEFDDSDKDGISDTWETEHFGDLATATATSDADGDGLSDCQESIHGTDPGLQDTDADGISDGDECAQGWNPLMPTAIRCAGIFNIAGFEDGLTWDSVFTSIQAAIDAVAAVGEGEVWVATGIYVAASASDDYVITMKPSVRLYGGFAGTETTRDTRMLSAYKTIIDGENTRIGVLGADKAVLDGFIIQNGNGGMYNKAVSPTVRHCIFRANTGGGMGNDHSSPVIINSVFTSNGGDALYNSASSPTLINCTLTNNTGIGLYNVSSAPAVTNCIIWADLLSSASTEVYNVASTPQITYSCVQGGYTGTGNIAVAPLFSDAVTADYTLHPGSPCINTGTGDGAPDTDLRGASRPQGGGVDMGAYEIDDADNDGLSDEWEYAHFGNLTTATAASDTDDDGLPDSMESIQETNPRQADTDTDGFSDGDEVIQGTNPLVATAVCRVNAASTAASPDGLSWATAFTSIQAAVDSVRTTGEGEVWVAAGTYTAMSSLDEFVVNMKQRVHIYGGFAGTESLRNIRDPELNPTIIDGEGVRRCIWGANNASLDGFTVQNGYGQLGGGMYNLAVSLDIVNCVFDANTATSDGAGIYNGSAAAPRVDHCVFSGNTTSGSGAGIYNSASSPVVTNCVFTGNTALQTGSGIASVSSSLSLANCVFFKNTAGWGAGVYYCNESSPTLTSCTFTANKAKYGGGAMYATNYTQTTLTNCVLWNNEATSGIDEIVTYSPATTVVRYSCVQDGYSGTGNIASDPLFTDPANDDYGLQSSSPCIDAGLSLGAPENDILGIARPQGNGYDMGAYEYVPQ